MSKYINDKDPKDYIFEYYACGNMVKVSAICCRSLKEVSVVVPRNLSQDQMMTHAMKKLEYVKKNKTF